MDRRSGMACLVVMMMFSVVLGKGEEYQTTGLSEYARCCANAYKTCILSNPTYYCIGSAASKCNKRGSSTPSDKPNTSGSSTASSDNGVTPKQQQYCELGCALSRCTNITTTQLNPNVDQLAKCFETCSENACKPKTSSNSVNGEQIYVGFCKLGCANSICGETTDKDTVCGSCATACSYFFDGDV